MSHDQKIVKDERGQDQHWRALNGMQITEKRWAGGDGPYASKSLSSILNSEQY